MPFPERRVPLIIAHRGFSASAPENTMAAFRLAAAAGAAMIELDVRMTADCELVVHHDLWLGRAVRGSGRLPDLSLRAVQALDAGVLFHRRYAGERVPLLVEMLAWLPRGMGLNVEVKTDGDTVRRRTLARRCADVLRRSGKAEQLVVTSFDHLFLRLLHRHDPRLATGILFQRSRDGREKPSTLARRAGARLFVCSRRQLRHHMIADAHGHGVGVWCYGVNTRADLRDVRRFAIDGIITDDPALMRDLLEVG